MGVASYGALSAQAFVDANGNGRMDPGEKPLPGAGVFVNGVARPEGSDAEGILYQHSIPADIRAKVVVNPSTLPDPMMQPGGEGFTFIPRAGHTTRLDLTVIQTGDVNGTVYLDGPSGARPFPGVTLELVGADGQVAASARSAYDGYYELQNFRPGAYTLRVNAEDVARRHLAPPPPRAFVLTGDKLERDGEDWKLRLAGAPVAPDPAPAPPSAPVPSTPVPSAPVPTAPKPAPTAAQLNAAVLGENAKTAADLSAAWLGHADLTGWAVRAQVGALPSTLLEAAERLDPKDGVLLLRPWALSNGQCARQFFIAGFKTKAAADRYAARLRRRQDLDPPKVMALRDLAESDPPCSFYAD